MDKVLFITAFLPCRSAAAEKNTMIMLKDMSKLFDVDLIYFKYKNQSEFIPESENIRVRRIFVNSTLNKILNVIRYPILHPYFTIRYNRGIKRYIESLLYTDNYKCIVLDHSLLFNYGVKLKTSLPKIMISHDVMAQRAERASNKIVAKFCLSSEGKMLRAENMHLFTFCQKDADLIKKYYDKNAKVCLDYIDDEIVDVMPSEITKDYTMLANWGRPDNADGAVWLFNSISFLIREKTVIHVIGKNFPKDRVKNDNPLLEIDYMGFVENPYPMIANCRAMISPLFTGAGIKVKVMESLACGTPVIGTDVAFEGFDSKFGNFMLLASSAEEFYNQMKRCNISLQERIAFKEFFINEYQSVTIPKYINRKNL